MRTQNNSRITASRAETIKSRSYQSSFGINYVPAIQVTRREAPSISKPSLLYSPKLERSLHLLSGAELFVALLALYVPTLRDLHEQKMLWLTPHEHPLASHPMMKGKNLSMVPGTAMVAKQFGIRHAIAWDDITEIIAHRKNVFFPYVGDLLLILKDGEDGLRCVNWYVKKSHQQLTFLENLTIDNGLPALKEKAERRYFMEYTYYKVAGIPTVAITEEDIDFHVKCNLRILHGYTLQEVTMESELKFKICLEFDDALEQGLSLNDFAQHLAMKYGVAPTVCHTLFYQLIWKRRLRVDLFAPILPDKPMRKERIDLLDIIQQRFLPR